MDKYELATILSEIEIGIVELTVGLEALDELVRDLRRAAHISEEDEDDS